MLLAPQKATTSGRPVVVYGLSLAALLTAVAVRWLLDPLLRDKLPLITLYGAIAFAVWLGGYRPAIVIAVLGYFMCDFLFLEPRGSFGVHKVQYLAGMLAYLITSSLIIGFGEVTRIAQSRARRHAQTLQTTLASIGDAVITTDSDGNVTYLNQIAEKLTGWTYDEAAEKALTSVFRIVNEQSRQPVENPVAKVLNLGHIVGLANHTVLLRRDGTEVPIDDSAAPIRDESGQMMGVILVFRDITERRKAEASLRRSERELSDFFENASVGLHWVGRDGRILRANQTELDLLGYNREEYVGRHIAEFHVDRPVIDDILIRLKRGETLNQHAARLRCKDGSIRDVIINSNVLFDDDKFVHTRCFTLDVTELKRAQEAQAQLAAIVKSSGDAIVSKSLEGIIKTWNIGAERLFGYTAAEAVGQPINLIIPPELQDEEITFLKKLRNGEHISHYETVRLNKQGQSIDISLSISPIWDSAGRIIGASKVARDITDRKRAADALREREKRYELVVAGTEAAIWDWDVLGKRVVYSPRWKQLRGLSDEEVTDSEEEWKSRIHPDDVERVLAAVQAHFDGRTGVFSEEYRVRHKDGHWLWVLDRGIARRDESGCVVRMAGSETDITDRKQAEEKLRESEERFRVLADSAPALIWVNGLEGCEFVNRRYLEFLGTGVSDVRGNKWAQFIHPDDREAYTTIYRQAMARQEPFDAEFRFRRHDGEYRWMRSVGHPRIDPRGELLGFSGLTIDTTERRQAEEALRQSEERSRELANNIDQFVWTCDQLGHVTWYNRRWYEYTGTTPEEMKDDGWRRVVHPDHLERVLAGLQRCVSTGESWEDTFPIRAMDSTYRWFLSRAIPIRNEEGHVARWFGTNTDVTDQRLLEEALKQADRRKDEFLATLAHELRGPLAPLRNMLEVIKHAESFTTLVQQARDTMDRQLDHMVRLVDDLLDVSRITRDKLELRKQRVELASVIHQAVETCRPLVEAANHQLKVTVPTEAIALRADAVRLAQVFSNLLSNACKYTKPDGKIGLTAQRQGSDVIIAVKDQGIGIAPEMLPRVFEMFAQADRSLERPQGGLGIGLTLVRRLVEMHGGSVAAFSEGIGRGSEFVVRLPILVEAPGAERRAPPTAKSSTSPRRILVVDDNVDSARSLAMLLVVMGNETQTAHDGAEALEAAEKFRPDAVLLDIGLPKINGYEVCRRIRQKPWGMSIIMVAITGWGQEDDRRRSEEVGFDAHLVKPVAYDALASLLADLLESPASS